MKTKLSVVGSFLFWGVIGSCLLYMIVAGIVEQVMLRKYQKVYDQVQHPQGTTLLEALRFTFSYYPATYIDESIGFEPAYVIGELRLYTGPWADVEDFYQTHKILPGGKWLTVIPLEIWEQKEQTWLNEVKGVSISPFDAQLLLEIHNRYSSLEIPAPVNGTESNLYLVYASWVKPKDPKR
jgi:hypothetical protein